MNLRIEPSILVGAAKDHRHSVVDIAHKRIGCPCQDRKRASLIRGSAPPSVPNPRDTHDGFILEVNFERALSSGILLPLEESAERDDAPLTYDEISIQRAPEYCLAFRVDRRELRFECGLPIGNELPV